jgi:hypothetical protein
VIVLATIAGWASITETRDANTGPTALQRLTASYVQAFIRSLSNVVGQEDFEFRKGLKVRSEFLLVRYPGTERDLLPFRDVLAVDGTPLPNRREHLIEMFQADFVSALGRAGQISSDSAAYVPVVLNPLYAVSFLQAQYQPRFKFDEGSAGREWPPRTKLLKFVETAKPTLLRAGVFRENDVPTRGTAWVEEGSGRILQTELQIRDDQTVTTVRTRFDVDARLFLMVPVEMQTQKPDGRAIYSKFRRFNVLTEEVLSEPALP